MNPTKLRNSTIRAGGRALVLLRVHRVSTKDTAPMPTKYDGADANANWLTGNYTRGMEDFSPAQSSSSRSLSTKETATMPMSVKEPDLKRCQVCLQRRSLN